MSEKKYDIPFGCSNEDILEMREKYLDYLRKSEGSHLVLFRPLLPETFKDGFPKGLKDELAENGFVALIQGQETTKTYAFTHKDAQHINSDWLIPVVEFGAVTSFKNRYSDIEILGLAGRDYSSYLGFPIYCVKGYGNGQAKSTWALMGPEGLLLPSGDTVSILDALYRGYKFYRFDSDTITSDIDTVCKVIDDPLGFAALGDLGLTGELQCLY